MVAFLSHDSINVTFSRTEYVMATLVHRPVTAPHLTCRAVELITDTLTDSGRFGPTENNVK